jgi:hypothetical protein
MVVREGTNVSMICKATGYPEPYVMWRREDGEDINYNGNEGTSNAFILKPWNFSKIQYPLHCKKKT